MFSASLVYRCLEAAVTVLIQPAGDDSVCVVVQTWNLAPMAVEIRSACRTGLGKQNLCMCNKHPVKTGLFFTFLMLQT